MPQRLAFGFLSLFIVLIPVGLSHAQVGQSNISDVAYVGFVGVPQGEVKGASTTAAGSCNAPLRTLRRGARNGDVTTLQNFLVSQNLLSQENATGLFGRITEAAVQQFQAQNGIVSNGSAQTTGFGAVGARTLAAIRARCAAAGVPSGNDPLPSAESTQSPADIFNSWLNNPLNGSSTNAGGWNGNQDSATPTQTDYASLLNQQYQELLNRLKTTSPASGTQESGGTAPGTGCTELRPTESAATALQYPNCYYYVPSTGTNGCGPTQDCVPPPSGGGQASSSSDTYVAGTIPSLAQFLRKANSTDIARGESLLSGVIGSNKDVRDWSAIMNAGDPFTAACQATNAMYNGSADYRASGATRPGDRPSTTVLGASGNFVFYKEILSGGVVNYVLALVDAGGYQLTSAANPDVLRKHLSDYCFNQSALVQVQQQIDQKGLDITKITSWPRGFGIVTVAPSTNTGGAQATCAISRAETAVIAAGTPTAFQYTTTGNPTAATLYRNFPTTVNASFAPRASDTVTVTFPSAGAYTVRLDVNNNATTGNTGYGTCTIPVTVVAPAQATCSLFAPSAYAGAGTYQFNYTTTGNPTAASAYQDFPTPVPGKASFVPGASGSIQVTFATGGSHAVRLDVNNNATTGGSGYTSCSAGIFASEPVSMSNDQYAQLASALTALEGGLQQLISYFSR